MSIEEYLDRLVEMTEVVEQQAAKHGMDCDCRECEAAWLRLKVIQDNEPPELINRIGE